MLWRFLHEHLKSIAHQILFMAHFIAPLPMDIIVISIQAAGKVISLA
jgi:hypothetical protein